MSLAGNASPPVAPSAASQCTRGTGARGEQSQVSVSKANSPSQFPAPGCPLCHLLTHHGVVSARPTLPVSSRPQAAPFAICQYTMGWYQQGQPSPLVSCPVLPPLLCFRTPLGRGGRKPGQYHQVQPSGAKPHPLYPPPPPRDFSTYSEEGQSQVSIIKSNSPGQCHTPFITPPPRDFSTHSGEQQS